MHSGDFYSNVPSTQNIFCIRLYQGQSTLTFCVELRRSYCLLRNLATRFPPCPLRLPPLETFYLPFALMSSFFVWCLFLFNFFELFALCDITFIISFSLFPFNNFVFDNPQSMDKFLYELWWIHDKPGRKQASQKIVKPDGSVCEIRFLPTVIKRVCGAESHSRIRCLGNAVIPVAKLNLQKIICS